MPSVSSQSLISAYTLDLPYVVGWMSGNDAAATTNRVFDFSSLSPQKDDYLVYWVATDNSGVSASLAPVTSGYQNPYLEAGAALGAGVWYKKLGTGETSVTLFPSSVTNRKGFVVALLRNIHGTFPVENIGSVSSGVSGAPNPSGVATLGTNAFVMAFGFIDDDNITAHTPPTGYTDAGFGIANAASGSTASLVGGSKVISDPSTEDPGVWTLTGGDDEWRAIAIAFRWKDSPYWGTPIYFSERGSTPAGMTVTDLGAGFFRVTQATADGIPRVSNSKTPASNGVRYEVRFKAKMNTAAGGTSRIDYGDTSETTWSDQLVLGQWVNVEFELNVTSASGWLDIRFAVGIEVEIGPIWLFPVGYRYYRWYITETRSVSSPTAQVSEFALQLGGTTITGLPTVTQPGGFSGSAAENSLKVYDGSTSGKWCDTGFNTRGFADLTFDFGVARVSDGYYWRTANDVQDRDPANWVLQGSLDNVTWVDLHTVSGFVATSSRNTWNTAETFTAIMPFVA